MFEFQKISYKDLNSRQQESYNFQKISGILADYGFITMRLSDDWEGADFIAQHTSGRFLKVQLKGRLSFYKKYQGKELHLCFPDAGDWYLFPHDELLTQASAIHQFAATSSWTDGAAYTFPSLSRAMKELLEPYKVG